MKPYFLILCCLLFFTSLFAQNEEQNSLGNEQTNDAYEKREAKYKLAVSYGTTHIPKAFENGKEEDAVFVPTIGLDFFYKIKERWSIGLIADLELAKYSVDFKGDDLNRENATLVNILGGYELLPKWEVLVGGGIEFEKEKNLAVFKTGTEYEFSLKDGWGIYPSLFFDFKENFNTWALAVAIGKRF